MASQKSDYHFLKSLVFATLRKAGINTQKLIASETDAKLFAMGESYTLNGKPIFNLGKLNSGILKQFDIKQEVYYAEIDWTNLLREVKPDSVKFAEISRYPEVRRDLALLLDKGVKFSEITALANRNGKGILRSVNLFDVYEGEKIEAGKKSYAISFTMQDDQKTLTDNDIEKLMKRLTEVFEKELGAVIRK
jgi:phenylalanyl-tRNA synthetase beta chain